MKMRKLTALVLSAALALGLCAVAPAAEHMSNFQKTASYTGRIQGRVERRVVCRQRKDLL